MQANFINLICQQYNNLILAQINLLANDQKFDEQKNEQFALWLVDHKDDWQTAQNLKDRLATNFSNLFRDRLVQYNQFIGLPQEAFLSIKDINSRFLEQLSAIFQETKITDSQLIELIKQQIASHLEGLLKMISKFKELNILSSDFVICSEYSAELQVKLLSLDIKNLKEPILDLGCGSKMILVKYLQELGYDAYGLDRTANMGEKNFIASDWFNFSFQPNYWGTIMSQMSFSNHFIYHHLSPTGQPEHYAKLYMTILSSLKSSGSFYYTPGLPFIEELLSNEQYIISKNEIDYPVFQDQQKFLEFAINYLYSMKILKK